LASWTAIVIPAAIGIAIGIVVFVLASNRARSIEVDARRAAERFEDEARRDADARAQKILTAAEEKSLALEDEWDRRDRELETREGDLESRSREFDTAAADLERRSREAEKARRKIENSLQAAEETERAAVARHTEATQLLERIAGLSAAEAKQELVRGIEDEARREGARLARKIEEEARAGADRAALDWIIQAAQQVRLRDVLETTVSYIPLPSDDMKGRIIGREGRNIRALENATGIDLIVDDTPQAILISSFDPDRRQIARVAIERLVEDGRIHPARIEEVVEKVREETATLVEEAGTQAAFELGMTDLHPRLLRRIGRMQLHIHHGGNLLRHCMEVAVLGAHMSAQVGARADVVRRAGLFHEIGRVDPEVSGHSALASAELVGRFGESDDVVHAIQALHPEVEAKSAEAILVRVAKKIADNRPGARKDNLEVFIERLRRVETVASAHDGVRRVYAVKAGKELRVVVDAARVGDRDVEALCREIARTLEREIAYPGQIKVSVVRETRAVTFAV
jgi:ribonuclease Y